MIPDSATTETLKVDRIQLLKFFDEKYGASKGDATGIVAVTGEDLSAACFRHYAESSGDRITIVPELDKTGKEIGPHPVTTGNTKGPRLDRWLEVKPHEGRRFLYQTEIKNWSAAAIGGENLSVEASPQEVADYKQRRWERHWDFERQTLKGATTAQVLVPMRKPSDYPRSSVKPLLIFWEALGPKERSDEHLFSLPVNYYSKDDRPASWPRTGKFNELWVFSVSSYLRSLKEPTIHLPMPNAARRIQTLNRLFSLTP